MEKIRQLTHAAHDLAGTIWYGGNVFGIMAANPAAKKATLKSDRGAVINQAWENFIPWGLGSALTFGATYAMMRFDEPRMDNPDMKLLTTLRDVSAISIVGLTLVGGVLNRKTAESAPDDRVPMEDGLTPAESAPKEAKAGLMGLRAVAVGNLVAGTVYFVSTALQEQALMDQPARGRLLLPFQRASRMGSVAMETAKAAAAVELIRRGAKMITDNIGITQPEPEPVGRWQQISNQARHMWDERVMAR
jgi:hypothetical protein